MHGRRVSVVLERDPERQPNRRLLAAGEAEIECRLPSRVSATAEGEEVFKLGTIIDMQWTGKLIGGALGLMLGPWGAAAGLALGHTYEVSSARRQARPVGEQFFLSTFRVMGHVAKADGRVSEREIQAARGVMQGLRLNEA